MASTLPIRSRLIRAQAAKFPSSARISVSKDGHREISVAPRSGDLLRADPPEGGILAQPLGVFDISPAGRLQDGLAKPIGERKLGVLAATRVAQRRFDELCQAEPFVQLPQQYQATIGGDPRSLEIDLPSRVEGKRKRLIRLLTPWVSPSGRGWSDWNPHMNPAYE
jgi:hypothetical protein